MLSKNSYSCFSERPEHETKQFLFRLLFLIPKVPERLLHRLAKLFSESFWIKGDEFLVENKNCCPGMCHKQRDVLIAIWDAEKTGHLVEHKSKPQPYKKCQKNDSKHKSDRFRQNVISRSHISYDRRHREAE